MTRDELIEEDIEVQLAPGEYIEDKKLKIYYESDNRAYVQQKKYPNFIHLQDLRKNKN